MKPSLRLGLLQHHDYRQLFASTTVSQFGVHITHLAVPLVAIMELDATPFQVGLLGSLIMAPFLLVGLPAGAWVDRMRRQPVLIAGDLGRAVVLATVPVAWWLDGLTLWHLYVVAVSYGVFHVFFDVAYQSYLPHLVGRANLVEGNSKLEAVRASAELGGPAIAGQLIRHLTLPVALLVNAVAMAASALFVARIRKREEVPERHPDANLLLEIKAGLRFVLGHRLLRAIVTCTATFNLLSSAYGVMLLLFLQRSLGLDAGTIGLVLTAYGAGGVAGAFLARRVAGWVGQGRLLWVSVAVTAPFMLLMPLIAQPGWWLWLAAAGLFVCSVGVVVYNVTQVSFRQAITPDDLLGRMNASIRFLVYGTMPAGALLGGVLGEVLGVRNALLLFASAIFLAFLPVFLSPLRTMRTMPTEPDKAGAEPRAART